MAVSALKGINDSKSNLEDLLNNVSRDLMEFRHECAERDNIIDQASMELKIS